MRRRLRALLVVGLGWLVLGWGTVGWGQAPPPRPDVPADLDRVVWGMTEESRRLGDDLRSNVPLAAEARELAQSLEEYRAQLPSLPDPFSRRRVFAGVDQTWHDLQGRLARPDLATPDVTRTAGRLADLDAKLHQILSLNAYPAQYYTTTAPLTGLVEVQRLAHALEDRAVALSAIVRAALVGGAGARLVQDAANLAQASDAFHDGLDLGADVTLARNGFAGVAVASGTFARDLGASAPAPPPQVVAAWQNFRATEVLLRQALGLPNEPAALEGTALAGAPLVPDTVAPLPALAERLVSEVAAFLQVFGPTARAVPEGSAFLGDAETLQGAALRFRDEAARGVDTNRLAYDFRDVDLIWQRLARRTNRISRGRTGPNIQQVGKMGATIAEIHRLLGMPGYAAEIVVP